MPDYYFQKDNNIQLRYFKKFNFNQLNFRTKYPTNSQEEIDASVIKFRDYLDNQIDTDIDKLKNQFMEHSHKSFLYSKSMCQDLLSNGVHHPIGIVSLIPSVVNSDIEKFHMDTGWRILNDDLVVFMYSGVARLTYFKILEWDYVPAFVQSPENHDIKFEGDSILIDSYDKLLHEYANHVEYDTQFYQQDKFFYIQKDGLEFHKDEDNLFFNRTNKQFGIDVGHECLSHLVCCDMMNDHKVKNWNLLNIPKYNKILKNTFPLKIYIRSDNQTDFKKCRNNIISSLGQKIDVEFISIYDKNEINQKKGFVFFTDSSLVCSQSILKLFYFTNSYQKEVEFKKGVSVINCEL